MLLGQVRSNLGENHTLVIPPPFRETYKDGAYVTRGFDKNLLLVTSASFDVMANQAGALNLTDPIARMLRRLILGNAYRVEMNDSGSIVLPQELLITTGINRDLILVGQGDYCEIWALDEWSEQVNELQDAGENANRFAGLNLYLR